MDPVREPGELADVDVGVVRAGFAIAATGSVWLSEVEFEVNALGFLSQHLVVLLDTRRIVDNLHHGLSRPAALRVEICRVHDRTVSHRRYRRVLIHGAQGIRTLTVIPLETSPD